ncbi:MAG: lipoyl(octanoyl) transferase LipB [Gammaproteobacteria bacterium]|nr:lipoyl(octanoyl) transferase LipB [Gammaproteobacteria bacterium]MDH5241820.1 lipoyl(octanoyl) transferase LipB [Gammaproteobacteria bacterium]MDH5262214.1 lipoyl(octanoyl) transferase LipB [Gammaproteobacteria bacterium]MDH5584308.1 lipoyl(octanoyl) transferase LipB [Gammaproteobacteria bacterium]
MKTVFRGRQDYVPLWREMQDFTDTRDESTPDEIWFVEHPPVFTMGLNASKEHLLAPGDIPVVQIDRGGQVTYHGPGQLMVYPLIDLKRANIGVRKLVTALEQSVVDLAAEFDVAAVARADAPGVYVAGDKLASVGLRIRRGSSFHGMALNVDADLEPFTRINPCGYAELKMTDLKHLGIGLSLEDAAQRLLPHFLRHLGLEIEEAQPK